jgi:glycerol-3-phosphate acyltransferase PlsY
VRSVTAVGLVSGPLILLGYAIGSLPVTYVVARRRLRRELGGTRSRPGGGTNDDAVVAALHALLTVAVATLAWHVTIRVAPGGNYRVPEASRIAFASTQVLTAWQSVALWTGLAAVVGHVAPVWGRFRGGGSGIVPALALLLAYAPTMFTAAVLAFFAGLLLTRASRPAVAVAVPMTVAAAWAAWLTEVPAGWGMVNGPEITLWAAVLGGVLFARWHRGDVLAEPDPQ